MNLKGGGGVMEDGVHGVESKCVDRGVGGVRRGRGVGEANPEGTTTCGK